MVKFYNENNNFIFFLIISTLINTFFLFHLEIKSLKGKSEYEHSRKTSLIKLRNISLSKYQKEILNKDYKRSSVVKTSFDNPQNNSAKDMKNKELLFSKSPDNLENKEILETEKNFQEAVLKEPMISKKENDELSMPKNESIEQNNQNINNSLVPQQTLLSDTNSLDNLDLSNKAIDKQNIESNVDSLANGTKLNYENYVAENQDVEGIIYNIIKSPEPKYPIMAKKAGISEAIKIKVKFLVDENGKVSNIQFYDNHTKYGFRESVKSALNDWVFSPVLLNGNRVKMYFYKTFIFEIKN